MEEPFYLKFTYPTEETFQSAEKVFEVFCRCKESMNGQRMSIIGDLFLVKRPCLSSGGQVLKRLRGGKNCISLSVSGGCAMTLSRSFCHLRKRCPNREETIRNCKTCRLGADRLRGLGSCVALVLDARHRSVTQQTSRRHTGAPIIH